MQVLRPHPTRDRDLCRFHADDYVAFLRSVTADETQQNQIRALKRFNAARPMRRVPLAAAIIISSCRFRSV
jgi:acetoin utilization deacetylase AcuC-like enzyme